MAKNGAPSGLIWRRHLLFRLPTNPRSSHPFKKSTVCPDTSAAVPETRRASWKPDPSFVSAQASTSAESTLDTLVREFLREERVPTPWYIIVPEGKGRTVWDAAVLLLILMSAISIPAQLAMSGLLADGLHDGLLVALASHTL